MNDGYSSWYSKFSELTGSFDDDELYESLRSLILSGQNVFSLNSKVMQKSVDISWVEAIEKGLLHLDNVIRSPRMTIEDVENIVPIALSRKITVESVKHLAQHTNLIQDYDAKSGKVTPSKVLNVYKEESMMTYENKFVNTLVDRLYIFINRRYDKLKEVRNDEAVSSLEYTSQIGGDEGGRMNVTLKLETADSLETVDDSGATTWDRIEKIRRTIESYKGSKFCMAMGSARIRPPVMRTNAILKNVDLKACLTLWQFIESYDKIGYELNISDTAQKPDDKYISDMYDLIALGFMLMRFHSAREDGKESLKTKERKPVSPKIIRKFEKGGQDDYDITVGVDSDEKKPDDYAPSRELPEDADEMLAEIGLIAEIEENYFIDEEERRLEAIRIAEEKERIRKEEERKRLEAERIAAEIQAEKERLERERREQEEKERQLQEMLEKQRKEKEERERQEREAAEQRERERLEKERLAAEEAERIAQAEREEQERIRQEALMLTEEERKQRELLAEQERIRKEEEKAARLERERKDKERALRLREERKLIEQKPFDQIYLEYSRDAGAVIRRIIIRLAKKAGLIKPKQLTETELGIQRIEQRCQEYYDQEQEVLRQERSEKRAAANRYDSYLSSPLSRIRIWFRNLQERLDRKGKH